jgi:hypothetical protein
MTEKLEDDDIRWLKLAMAEITPTGHCGESSSSAIYRGRIEDRARRILEALTAWNTRPSVVEPVAWRYLFGGSPDGCWSYAATSPEPEWAEQCRQVQPLYTRPDVVPDRQAFSEREVMLFDLAWDLVAAIRGGGPLPHTTPKKRADLVAPILSGLLELRNRGALLAAQEG